MKKYFLLVSAFFLFQSIIAQNFERRDEVMKRIEAIKVGFFTKELDLTPEEAKAFWPVYEEYQNRLEAQKDARRVLLNNVAKFPEEMNDDELNELIDHRTEQAKQALDARLDFIQSIREFLPPIKVVRYYKAEDEFRSNVLERIKKESIGKERPNRRP